jgi:hypothetical protein
VLASIAGLLLTVTGSAAAVANEVNWPVTADRPGSDLSGWVGPCKMNGNASAPPVRGRFGCAYTDLTRPPSNDDVDSRVGYLFPVRLRAYDRPPAKTSFNGRISLMRGEVAHIWAGPVMTSNCGTCL